MARGRGYFRSPVVDFTGGTGEIDTGATVHIYQMDGVTPITDTIYADPTSLTQLTQPLSSGNGITGGFLAFALDRHQIVKLGITPSGGSELPGQFVTVGSPDGLKHVEDFGAKFDGVTDDTQAIYDANASLEEGEPLYFPFGTGLVSDDVLVFPYEDGGQWVGVGGGGTNRLGGTVLKAKNGADLWAIVATQQVRSNNSITDMAQGREVVGMSFWGGGFTAGSVHNTAIETTANTLHGAVIHQSGIEFRKCQFVSANGYTLYLAGKTMDGSPIVTSESHEIRINDCAMRYAGSDLIHGDDNVQDGSIFGWTKTQYAGRHGIYLEDAQGWSLTNLHPSWAVGDLIHLTSCWQTEVTGIYDGSIGEYMDNTGYPLTHYGVYAVGGGPILVHHNRFNTNASGGTPQHDAVTPIYLQGSEAGICDGNALVYQTGDNVVKDIDGNVIMVETSGVDAGYPILNNNARIGH